MMKQRNYISKDCWYSVFSWNGHGDPSANPEPR